MFHGIPGINVQLLLLLFLLLVLLGISTFYYLSQPVSTNWKMTGQNMSHTFSPTHRAHWISNL